MLIIYYCCWCENIGIGCVMCLKHITCPYAKVSAISGLQGASAVNCRGKRESATVNCRRKIVKDKGGLILSYYFFYPIHFSRFIFFTKMFMGFSNYIIWIKFSTCFKVETWAFHQFGFYNPNTPKNRAHSLVFSYYRIRTSPKHRYLGENWFRLHNPNCISTNFEHIRNMDI